jgi:hypothetical protein
LGASAAPEYIEESTPALKQSNEQSVSETIKKEQATILIFFQYNLKSTGVMLVPDNEYNRSVLEGIGTSENPAPLNIELQLKLED